MTPTRAVVEFAGVIKDYRGLRPLRIRQLSVAPGEAAALTGFDAPMAETFVNLVTGAALPDEGEVTLFGRATSAITDSTDWLTFVDRFGIVSERAVLLDQMTVIQNLAMPFTLDVEPPPDDVRRDAERLALEAGLDREAWDRPVFELDGAGRARVRLGRALALNPEVLLLEHPTAMTGGADAEQFGRMVRAIAAERRLATIAITADETFARALSPRVLVLEPASGRLSERRKSWLGVRMTVKERV